MKQKINIWQALGICCILSQTIRINRLEQKMHTVYEMDSLHELFLDIHSKALFQQDSLLMYKP